MVRIPRWALAVGVCAASASLVSEARAAGPLDVEVAAKFGGGTAPSADAANPLGIGLGGRVGVALSDVYGGVSVVDYFDGYASGPAYSAHSLLYGVEAGYSTKLLDALTLRAVLGFGGDTETVGNTKNDYLYLEPAVVGLFSVGNLLLGADVGVLLLPFYTPLRDGYTGGLFEPATELGAALSAHVQIGFKLR